MPYLFATLVVWTFFYLIAAFVLMFLMALWHINKTAKRPAWLALIPGINILVLHQIAGQPWWWVILWFIPIPLIRFFLIALLAYGISVKFNKGGVYTLGLTFLPFVFYPHIAFGDAEYYPDAE